LDYFLARYYSSAQGRYTSPDPLFIEMRRLSDPQQLNIYSYTRSNPLKFIDPLGLDITVTGSLQGEYDKDLQKKVSFTVHTNAKSHKVEIVGSHEVKSGRCQAYLLLRRFCDFACDDGTLVRTGQSSQEYR
jgi:RHS repeat-associated protein